MSITIIAVLLLAVAFSLTAFLLGAFWRDMQANSEHRGMASDRRPVPMANRQEG